MHVDNSASSDVPRFSPLGDIPETPRVQVGYTVEGSDTLEHVAQQTAVVLQLTPMNAKRFIADWLSEWEQRGFSATSTVDQVQKNETDGWVWDRLCVWMSQYVKYHTDDQLADFLLFNLVRMTNKNVLKGFEALTERSKDGAAQRLMLDAYQATEILGRRELSELLHQLAQPS